jgi:hypothetical protein
MRSVISFSGWKDGPSRQQGRAARSRVRSTNPPMRILLDNGIFSHSEFSEDAIRQTSVRWGDTDHVLPVQGFVRKSPDKDPDYQRQKEALFTIGRLIREGRIEAYNYIEILFEGMRGSTQLHICNAQQGCNIHECRPALERSKFRWTINFRDTISKGGKKDRKTGVELGEANQIAFLEWLFSANKEYINALISHAALINLDEFEVASLKKLDWFKFLCQRSGSRENYPDVFHLWTAERNGLDAVLTLEKRLPNLVSGVRKEKVKRITITTEVLRPLELLQKLGIERPDPVPMAADRFYNLHEITR